jgi:putative ABC transport system substrate-binding protein
VRRKVAIIVTPLGTAAALAAKAATTTIPVVFSVGVDPVKAGLVPSLSRPGGNVAGINYMQSELVAKRLRLLQEMVPRAARFGLLVNRTSPVRAEGTIKKAETAASAIFASNGTGNFRQRTGNLLVRIGTSNFDPISVPQLGR